MNAIIHSTEQGEQVADLFIPGNCSRAILMNGNRKANHSDRMTRVVDHRFRGPYRDSHLVDPNREVRGQSPGSRRIGAPSASAGFNAVIQNAGMTFGSFVETKFIPEHVEHKTRAGRTHYQAMLKHLIGPEIVHRMFDPGNVSSARLKSIPEWPYIDQVRLCDLNSEHVRRLVAAAFERDYSWQTVKHIKNVAFAVIAHAQQEGCFPRPNPVAQVTLPPKTHRATPDLSIDQTRAILQLLPAPEKHIALFILTAGMNIQEICNLRWKHVNLTESSRVLDGELIPPYCIAVRTQWNRTGLGNASQNRMRNIVIPASLFAVLANWAIEKGTLNPEEFVLVTETRQPILPVDLWSSRLALIGRKLGMPWLSWRVLGRAHLALLSELRPQLDYMIGNAGLNGLAALSGISSISMGSPQKSATIRYKFSRALQL